jgi:hypothetical protein
LEFQWNLWNSHIVMTVCKSAEAAAGTWIRQCPQRYRDLTMIRIAKPTAALASSFRHNLLRVNLKTTTPWIAGKTN